MTRQGPRPTQPADIRKAAERVGTEEITTPAGTFTCEHYRTKDQATDVWVSEKVAPMSRAFWTGALVLASVLAVAGSPPEGAEPGAKQSEAAAVIAPAETVRVLQAALGQAVQRFEVQDMSGVLAYVSDQYRTGPLTKPTMRDQLIALSSIYDAVSARIRIDEVQMVGEHAWVYSTGEVSGRLRFLGTWIVFLSWQHELEVARQEAGGWRLFGYQQ